ncbi:fungal specific transcription factor domain-containing protein [Aspergillus foveolatus]|uniref:fungal specific transcription factor domain-containing protein n=1 Tax=Aspergillus foveolatus TaxID=210207 RepID=UPI003CCDBFEA
MTATPCSGTWVVTRHRARTFVVCRRSIGVRQCGVWWRITSCFRHNLCTVQSLVLLIYAINHAQGPAWSLLGTTLHIAVAIGFAVDPSRLNVDRIEAEERRRCWAALQMLYTIQNTCLGNLMPFRIDSQVDVPADIDDEDLSLDRCPNDDPSAFSTKMTYLLYKFRLYNFAFDIQELSMSSSSHFVRFAARPITDLEPYHQAHYYILANYTNHLMLLLYRPYISTANFSTPLAQSPERCENAAMTILSNFERLASDPLFQSYRWYVDGLGSFYVFLSITALLILHGNGQPNTQSGSPTLDLVRRCVDILMHKAPRSAVCSKAAAILEPIVQHLDPLGLRTGQANSEQMSPVSGEETILSAFPELGGLFFDVPCEQWLTPGGFPWVAS